jgi:hypothetical protein
MALYNFQQRFVPHIQDGTKTHTIREIRKYPQKVGKLMYLYSGLRVVKPAFKIIEPPVCLAVKTIIIMGTGRVFIIDKVFTKEECKQFITTYTERKRHHFLSQDKRNELAWRDGFRVDDNGTREGCWMLMARWFAQTHQLPFSGHINYWKIF